MNKLYSVVYSPKAKDDLKEIYTYIAFTLSVPTTAEKQINRISKAPCGLPLIAGALAGLDPVLERIQLGHGCLALICQHL